MDSILHLLEQAKEHFKEKIELQEDGQGINSQREVLVELFAFFKNNAAFSMLLDITAVDHMDSIDVIYHLMQENGSLFHVKVKLANEDLVIPSIISIWKSANVMEREIFDLMGVIFAGHSELKRILCPADFEHHPLRKDFKLDVIDRFS